MFAWLAETFTFSIIYLDENPPLNFNAINPTDTGIQRVKILIKMTSVNAIDTSTP